ncbi:MAG: hypothetical protein ACOC1K_05065 [Nanoarchaeota archaeon]
MIEIPQKEIKKIIDDYLLDKYSIESDYDLEFKDKFGEIVAMVKLKGSDI